MPKHGAKQSSIKSFLKKLNPVKKKPRLSRQPEENITKITETNTKINKPNLAPTKATINLTSTTLAPQSKRKFTSDSESSDSDNTVVEAKSTNSDSESSDSDNTVVEAKSMDENSDETNEYQELSSDSEDDMEFDEEGDPPFDWTQSDAVAGVDDLQRVRKQNNVYKRKLF